ncbi:hypothetical protein G6F62_011673 [Rhizopus arrhizus]|uniref:Uncharacterized protein n=1 Tax=Rhizopus oryzae TaxID=64495 RepID=A0A9P6WWJ5_RHIOR|nr:hypothetical protein G6F23_012105 [Rhizopus arrhizus]KAG0776091.1 hypothetical protein G6F22_012820 [Rhizopus arrhizus]KAG0778944.1 hypothetical protein G6F21_012784 [Rhizopus arrhizus]KAG0804611.1 hypothetical protein G6F20_012559 [Rhizopus arrhizus]KAG0816105.1 hypothetical protein G6F19_012929 [Rhizopus arrhizus]
MKSDGKRRKSWGDTTSPHLSLLHLHFNLDFRIVIKDINTEALDTLTGELARESAIAPHKVYFDFLKSALATKAHLNAALRRLPYIPPSAIKLFIFPFVQIMGLTCNVYDMNIIDKKVYTIQKLASFNYPSTNREVKNGGVKALIDAFGLVESMINNIDTMLTEYNKTTSSKMDNIKKGQKNASKEKIINIDEYISAVKSYFDSDLTFETNEKEDENEDSTDEEI